MSLRKPLTPAQKELQRLCAKRYFLKNKEARQELFRKRYAENKAFREGVKGRSKNYCSEITSGKRKRRASVKMFNGVEGFGLRFIALATGVLYDTLRKFACKGIIPTPSIKGVHRYYTKHQVTLIRHFLVERAKGRSFEEDALRRLHKRWTSYDK